ncbi:14866_t:CDS:2 [Funneliformis geosporum]|uniref:14866_t:CDS:1 n=1 Tax=Funneliformis geosporum TaxID=1117311 RepID=A0A9W4WYV5_9GLOM|nr:14866_t:CDS:2 [Funneliformis geosporum]
MMIFLLRTCSSITIFSEGLFNGSGPLDTCKSHPIFYWTVPFFQDDGLAMSFSCRRWNETVFNNYKLLENLIKGGENPSILFKHQINAMPMATIL